MGAACSSSAAPGRSASPPPVEQGQLEAELAAAAGQRGGAVLCSWGAPRDDEHKYVVRLAVAEDEEDAGGGRDGGADEAEADEAAQRSGAGAALRRSGAWSDFVPVSRHATLCLAHPDGETTLLLRLALHARVSGGVTHRLAVLSPAVYLHSHARLPLRCPALGARTRTVVWAHGTCSCSRLRALLRGAVPMCAASRSSTRCRRAAAPRRGRSSGGRARVRRRGWHARARCCG